MKTITRFINKKVFWLVYKFRPIYMFPFPSSICIDASTHCNLNCVCCPTGKGSNGLSKGFLKYNDFKNFVDKYGRFLERIQLSNYGEIFLNPEIFKIIQHAENQGIKTYADTNLNYFNDAMAENLVQAKMTGLTISIDGTTNESYSKYRKNGHLDKVLLNIERINKFKNVYNLVKPELTWQFVLFGHNEHEVDHAREMAEELKMHFIVKSNWDPEFSPTSASGPTDNDLHDNLCNQLWHMPVINFNGNMLGCCVLFDEEYHLGNAFKNSFFRIYNGQKMRNARKVILKRIEKSDSIYCGKCNARDK